MTAYSTAEARAAVDSSQDGLWSLIESVNLSQAIAEYQPDGTITRANRNFHTLLGYGHTELVGRHHHALAVPAEDTLERSTALWARLARGEEVDGEFLQLARDGRHLWLRSQYHPVLDAQGQLARVVQFASDCTESMQRNAEVQARHDAIDRVQAIIEFDLGGHVIHANDNFLQLMGYPLDEIRGKHHRLFCTDAYIETPEYAAFWEHLASGQVHSGEFKRLARDGRDIWIQASYNPVFDPEGHPVRVIKFATDITESKLRNAEAQALLDAIERVQAVIEFDLGGHVLHANQKFLDLMGYRLEDIRGRHHRMFCEDAYAASPEYEAFWDLLGSGHVHHGEFKRLSRDGQEVWIQASYNPVFDPEGHPVKVVKFANDITPQIQRERQIAGKVAAISQVLSELSGSIGNGGT